MRRFFFFANLSVCEAREEGQKHQAAYTHVTEQSLTRGCERERHTEAPLYLKRLLT